MRAYITGVAGFLGSHIAERLLKDGYEVAGVDDLSTGRRENVPSGVDFTYGSILDVNWWLTPPVDVVYHCAASYHNKMNWERDARTNVLGTIAVTREAARVGAKLVYFQTALCYGPQATKIQLTAPLNPYGSYAVSKTAGENYIRDSGVPYVSLRLANIYGPRNLSGPIPTFYKRLSEGQPVTVVDTRRDFVFVDDLVWMAVTAARRGEGPYHVSSGADFSIAEVYGAICRAMDIDPGEIPLIPPKPDDAPSLLLDPSATFSEFNWRAITPLATGIEKAVEWYRMHGVQQTFTHLEQKG